MAERWTIISLGGAVIVPDRIDTRFLRRFRDLICSFRRQRFVIVCGGGATNRQYNTAARALGRPTDEDLDWIGIRAIKLNAELVRTAFGRLAYRQVLDRPRDLTGIPRERVIVAAAFAPGHSSDYDAVLWARRFGAQRVLNLSNIPAVYTGDPRRDRAARPVTDMRWPEFQEIVGTTWSPRLSTPFDPIATKLAARVRLSVLVLNGRDIPNVRRAIEGKPIQGTVLHP